APSMLIFWNRYVSHTLTAGGGDTGDLFEIMAGSQPGTYVVDGIDQNLLTHNETIVVKHGSPISVDIEETTYGPIINSIVNGAPANRKFALRLIEHYRLDQHSIVAGIRLMSATSLTTYRDALRYWMLPTVNAVYAGVDKGAAADDTGHIAYHALVGIAKRASTFIVSGLDFTGRHPQDGSDSANDWQGVYDLEWNPHVTDPDNGYLFSGNHIPVGTWYHDLFYSGIGGLGDSYRSFQLRTMLARLFPTAASKITQKQAHEMHYDGGFYLGEILKDVLQVMEDRAVIALPAVPTDAPVTDSEKAAKLLQVLNLWIAEGGELKSTSKYFQLLKNLPIALIGASRYSVSPDFSCRWHEAQGGVLFFAKSFLADPTILATAETGFLMLVGKGLWDNMMDRLPETNPDPTTWTTPTAADVYTAKHHSAFFCNSYNKNCSLDSGNDVAFALDLTHGDTVNAASTSSWPATADFADIDGSKALLAPGVDEEPSSSHYDDMVSAMENVSKGQDAMPLAPLSRDKLNLGPPDVLTVP
ncbi:MAG: penicillin acylase family protein, partial [Kofleriaceae bacterium]|nr:penicillin acylase family protein [Kofleriaceae bacterium]